MKQIFLPNNPEIAVKLRLSGRARRLSLRISSLDGQVTLSGPAWVPSHDFAAFVAEKEDWILANLSKMPTVQSVTEGQSIMIRGQSCRIVRGAHRGVQCEGGLLSIPRAAKSIGGSVRGYLKAQARDDLARASDAYAAKLGVSYASLVLRDTRSRWGSCSSHGQLMYSWRLILAPPEILSYVAAHEVAHLNQMNHSPAFWRIVQHLYGDYAMARDWLKRHGPSLHRYDFDT